MARFAPSDFAATIASILYTHSFFATAAKLVEAVSSGFVPEGGRPRPYTEKEEAAVVADFLTAHITAPYRMWEYTTRLLNNLNDDKPIPEETEFELILVDADGETRPLGTPRMAEPIEQIESIIRKLRGLGPGSDPDPDMGPPKLGPLGPGGDRPRGPNVSLFVERRHASMNHVDGLGSGLELNQNSVDLEQGQHQDDEREPVHAFGI